MALISKAYEVNTENICLKVLVYGEPGLGKSTLAISMPKALLIDCDGGIHRIQAAHRTDYVTVDSYAKIQALLQSDEIEPFQTIVFDTAGKLLDYMSADIIKQNPKMARADGALTMQGYGMRKMWFVNLLKQVSTMGKHLMFVAHAKEEKRGDESVARPEIGGSSSSDLMKELDLVGYMEAQGKRRTVSFFPTDRFYAKNSARIDDVLIVPELSKGVPNDYMTQIVAKVKEAISEETEDAAKYKGLMVSLRAQVESVDNAKTANRVLKILSKTDHLWDSKQKSWVLLCEKVRELGMEYSKDEKCFISPNTPEAEQETEEEPELVLSGMNVSMPGIES